jgi:hypothetical protein
MPFPPAPPEKKTSLLSLANWKKYRFPILAASIMGGPVAYFERDTWQQSAATALKEWSSESDAAPPAAIGANPTAMAGMPAAVPYGGTPQKVDPVNQPMPVPEVFNWEITPDWVASRWQEVSLGMADVSLTGHRVTLVTGPTPQDLAGALTYYFDVDQKLQRIRFEGVTGDPRPLVAQMALRHRFMRCATNVPGTEIYQVHLDGKARGEMRIRSAPVVRTHSQLGRYSVSVAIDRPK